MFSRGQHGNCGNAERRRLANVRATRSFIYGVGVGIALSFAVVFALNTHTGVDAANSQSAIIVAQ